MGNAVYVATETGSSEIDGQHYAFQKGETRVREGHPLLDLCPELFAPADEDVTFDVETATSSPRGKRRGPKPTEPEKPEEEPEAPDEPEEASSDGGDDEEPEEDLSELPRRDLDELAASLGVTEPKKIKGGKPAVIAAIKAARSGE